MRRSAVIFLALVAAAGYTGVQAMSPWFAHRSGIQLDPFALSSGGVVATSTGMRPVMFHMLDAPAPLTLLAIGVVISGFGFAMKLALLPVLAAGSVWMARSAAVNSETLLLSGRYTRDFVMAQGSTYPDFLTGAWLVIGLCLALAAQIAYTAHQRSRAEGSEPEGVLATVGAVQSAALSRFSKGR